MKKKLLSASLLALCLVMTLVPMTAFAEGANINVWDGSTAAAFAGGQAPQRILIRLLTEHSLHISQTL